MRLKPAQQLLVVRERQARVQAVDDVDLGERLIAALAQLLPGLLERHRVGAGRAFLEPRERAEQAARLADVGRLEAQVVVVEGARAVPLLALAVGELADGEQVGRLEQADAVGELQADAGVELVGDVAESGAVDPVARIIVLLAQSWAPTNSTLTGAGTSRFSHASSKKRRTAVRPRSP